MKNMKQIVSASLLSAFECVAELNADLLKSTVSEVLVTRQNVKLRLKNGQILRKE